MTIPSAVVFDLGKVLLDFDYRLAIQRLVARSATTSESLRQLIDQSSLLLAYEAGGMSSMDFFSQVKAQTGFLGDYTEFKEIFGDIFTPIPPMIQLFAELKARNVPTYILSNTNEIAVQFIRAHYPFFHQFDGYILSYEQKAMKPQARIYEAVERQSGASGAQLLYLDDRPENIEPAVARGWQAFIHETPEKSRAILVHTGLLADGSPAASTP